MSNVNCQKPFVLSAQLCISKMLHPSQITFFPQVQRWEHSVNGSLKSKISPCDPSDWILVFAEGHAEQSGGCELKMRMQVLKV